MVNHKVRKKPRRSNTKKATRQTTKTSKQAEVAKAAPKDDTKSASSVSPAGLPLRLCSPNHSSESKPLDMSPLPPGLYQPLIHHLTRLLYSRSWPKTICPSEVPRALSSAELSAAGRADWRELMPLVRALLFEMRDRGEVEILQKGEVLAGSVRLDDVKGPVRARLVTRDE